jgi:hypothetical protein
MDKLTEELDSLSSDDLAVLRTILEVSSSSGKTALAKAMCSYGGIDRIFSRLSTNEIRAAHLLSKAPSGLTYGELSRELECETDEIEKISKNLHSKALVYILKNRKHLNNRLDKVYIQSALSSHLSFMKDEELSKYISGLSDSLVEKNGKGADIPKKGIHLMAYLIETGGAATYTAIIASGISDPDPILTELTEKGLVSVFHAPAAPFATLVVLTQKGFFSACAKKESAQKTSINNRYYLLNNILLAYDMVTSRGLYLTQQHEFRKTDFKRVSDTLIPMHDQRGLSIDPDDSARFALHILSRLGALSLKKDAVQIDITPIEKFLSDPAKFCITAARAAVKKQPDDPLFQSPFAVPSFEEIEAIIEYIHANPGTEFTRLRMSFILGKIQKTPSLLRTSSDAKSLPGEKFAAALRYAFLFGIISLENGVYSVRPDPDPEKEKIPSAYINPDYTVMVAPEEIPGEVLYKILACSELKQNDVIMQCKITRESILFAHKRRMNPDKVVCEFEPYLKNGIPQNLHFMVKEWISQSLEVSIREALVLKTNHASFIDDLLAGSLKSAVIERISPTHAIVKRDSVDDLVRAATKHSAIITLFGS